MLDRAVSRMEGLGRADVVLRRMDARELVFENGSFDRVLAPYVISVVPEPEKVLSEMHRVCKPGGKVVVVNHFGSENAFLRFCEKALTPASQWLGFRLDLPIHVVLRHPGFRVERIEKVNLLGLWRLVELRRIDGKRRS
jgi:phosphatidylethanolamine/phosphatidyl-N-methylethanolamine N-methyltransferase